jgi:hypothetical protein
MDWDICLSSQFVLFELYIVLTATAWHWPSKSHALLYCGYMDSDGSNPCLFFHSGFVWCGDEIDVIGKGVMETRTADQTTYRTIEQLCNNINDALLK